MANLFPEIEVFTTSHHQWQTPDSIKHTPLKFAKELKVLDLHAYDHDFQMGDTAFENIFKVIIDKLEADGVVRIGLVSFPGWNRIFQHLTKPRPGFPGAECVAKILSRVTVDHLIFETESLRGMYAICAQIDDMHLQSPINVYFPNIPIHPDGPIHSDGADQSQLRLGFKDKIGPRKMTTTYLLVAQGVNMTGDDAGTCKMMTVHLRASKLYGPSDRDSETKTVHLPASEHYGPSYGDSETIPVDYRKSELSGPSGQDSEIRLTETQGLSLEGFPHIAVNPHCNFDNIAATSTSKLTAVCNDLEITTDDEWPIQQIRNDKMNEGSVCFDSRIDSKPYWLNEVTDPDNSLDLHADPVSLSIKKISPHSGPQPSVTVAVLDTGILACHEAFKDKIVAMKNFVPNEAIDLYYDANGHGTHCAGIVLRTAPFVRLVVCKVLSSQGPGSQKWTADAIDWLLNDESGPKNYCPVDIISMSLGGNTFNSNQRRAVSDAIAQGKVVVAAASNDGRRHLTNIAFPARFGDVICVGSCNNLGQPSSFTPTGREIDFLAHGEDIQAPSSDDFDRYQRMSGTSQATPRVAGIAARVISYAEAIGGQRMRSAVCHTAVMREVLRKMASMPGHHDEHMGYGNLDPWRLFKYGPDHFRQVVEEIVGPLPVLQPERQDAETQTHEFSC